MFLFASEQRADLSPGIKSGLPRFLHLHQFVEALDFRSWGNPKTAAVLRLQNLLGQSLTRLASPSQSVSLWIKEATTHCGTSSALTSFSWTHRGSTHQNRNLLPLPCLSFPTLARGEAGLAAQSLPGRLREVGARHTPWPWLPLFIGVSRLRRQVAALTAGTAASEGQQPHQPPGATAPSLGSRSLSAQRVFL